MAKINLILFKICKVDLPRGFKWWLPVAALSLITTLPIHSGSPFKFRLITKVMSLFSGSVSIIVLSQGILDTIFLLHIPIALSILELIFEAASIQKVTSIVHTPKTCSSVFRCITATFIDSLLQLIFYSMLILLAFEGTNVYIVIISFLCYFLVKGLVVLVLFPLLKVDVPPGFKWRLLNCAMSLITNLSLQSNTLGKYRFILKGAGVLTISTVFGVLAHQTENVAYPIPLHIIFLVLINFILLSIL